MQHAGIQYGQGAANSHQSPPFVHADISQQTNGGNTTSSLRQFRKKDGLDKNSSTDLSNPSIGENNSHIARVPPHNHYPARPNDYYRYHHQYPDYNPPYKEPTAQVKYSEIAETPPQPIQHVDHIQKHKEPHKEFMDMCNITQQAHMKQNYPDNLSRQQSYPPDASSVHHQYIHKEPQVHPTYKPESQYQQYPQLAKYNMPSQCRKYPPPPPENDFLAKLQRINPSMARSIMSDHHIRESQTTNYPSMDQNRMYPQNQRYYPTHVQNNPSYNYHMQPYNYPSSCNYKHPDYTRPNQIPVGAAQYPNPHPERSISPRNLHMSMNYGATPQKISPNYSQYNPPEYAQHYQHRRASMPQDYYQQPCRNNPYIPPHQISPEPNDNRASSGLRHFIENWAEEEASAEIAPLYKENRLPHNDANNEQVFVINSSDIPQCLENVSLVPTENGQYILKSGTLDNSVVRIKETTENNGERTVNLQIVDATPKSDCMMADSTPLCNTEEKTNEDPIVPYPEKQTTKDCDQETKTTSDQSAKEKEKTTEDAGKEMEEAPPLDTPTQDSPPPEKSEENSSEASVIVCNEVSVIKDMPLIEEDHGKKTQANGDNKPLEETEEIEDTEETEGSEETSEETAIEEKDDVTNEDSEETKNEDVSPVDSQISSTTKRTQRIFSVDDIINNIGSQSNQTRRNSLPLTKTSDEDAEIVDGQPEEPSSQEEEKEEADESTEEVEFASAISIENDSVILEIGGALVHLNINHFNGTKVLSVHPLSESLVIDVNGNYQNCEEVDVVQQEQQENSVDEENTTVDEIPTVEEDSTVEEIPTVEEDSTVHENPTVEESCTIEETVQTETEIVDEMDTTECQSEIVIGEESMDNEVFIDLTVEKKVEDKVKVIEEKVEVIEEKKEKPIAEPTKKKERKTSVDDKRKLKENEEEKKKSNSSRKFKEEERPRSKKVPPKVGDDDTKGNRKKVEDERPPNVSTKAAKKLYETDPPPKKPIKEKEVKSKSDKEDRTKPKFSKLEETVNKIKSMKAKSVKEDNKTKKPTLTLKDTIVKKAKPVKKVTFNLEAQIREIAKEEITKEEIDRKRLSWEEYNSRKRKSPSEINDRKIMEDTVTSSEDINDQVVEQVELSIEKDMRRKSPPKLADNNWEDEIESPKMPEKSEVISTKINRCIIDVNEFNIKPIESVSTPSPVSSSQFTYHSEDDSLQVYKDVVDSKLNSLNIKIPKLTKSKPVDKFSVLLERFLNKGTLNCNELEKVKKIIEFKRKIEEKQLTYEVRGEREYQDLKLHFKKVPEQTRTRKRFRNLYTDDTSEDSDSSRSENGVGDYSVYQRNSQGVPKLIFKRKSGLPQPFVKLERSQAVELLAKKRKLY